MYDYIIIGAGPAGIQVAYNLQKHKTNYLLLEGGDKAGHFFETYPRHRTLISINKRHTGSDNPEYNLRHDWNSLLSDQNFPLFTSYDEKFLPDADNLVRYLGDYVQDHQLNVRFNQRVKIIDRQHDLFQIKTLAGEVYQSKRLIIATGVAKPYIPNIPGIELAEQYEQVSTDKSDFVNQRVLVIGKGNSAFETADHLIDTANLIHICSPNAINMAWKTHYVGDLRAVNNNLLDTYQLKSQNAVLDAEISGITRDGARYRVQFGYAHANGECEAIVYDKIICCTGFRMDRELFSNKTEPQMAVNKRFPKLNERFESVNVKDMYFAGTLTQSINYRKTTSGFIHGFRYNAQALVEILMQQYEHKSLPHSPVALNSNSIAKAILDRINQTSALWQQHGFLVDAFVPTDGGSSAAYYQQLPRQYCHHIFADKSRYLLIALDFGAPIEGDPFNQVRVHKDNANKAQESKFLHPIIYLCKDGKEIAEHHIIEDLEADWTDQKVHHQPLADFIEQHVIRFSTESASI